jgi:nucleoid DNA-binding protein
MRGTRDRASVSGSRAEARLIMNKAELARALVTEGAVERQEDAEAVLDVRASAIWHSLEHYEALDWSGVGQFGVAPAPRRRRTVTFRPASELEVAVNRHYVEG